jgi:hypothetical protein
MRPVPIVFAYDAKTAELVRSGVIIDWGGLQPARMQAAN